jgi:hypothetical protein
MNGTKKVEVKEIAQTSKGLPVPRLIISEEEWVFDAEMVAKGFPSKNRREMRMEYDVDEPNSLPPDEEFTLSAFGLPEPRGLEWKKPTRWYLWLAVGGSVCLICGASLAWVKRWRTEQRP